MIEITCLFILSTLGSDDGNFLAVNLVKTHPDNRSHLSVYFGNTKF